MRKRLVVVSYRRIEFRFHSWRSIFWLICKQGVPPCRLHLLWRLGPQDALLLIGMIVALHSTSWWCRLVLPSPFPPPSPPLRPGPRTADSREFQSLSMPRHKCYHHQKKHISRQRFDFSFSLYVDYCDSKHILTDQTRRKLNFRVHNLNARKRSCQHHFENI